MDLTDLFDVFSEDFVPFLPGSFVYCDPSEVETWTESIPFGEFALPSPPESGSECGSLDSQDMSSRTWSQASQPEEWTPASAQDYSTYLQPSASGWMADDMPVTAQDTQAANHATWLSATAGHVDQGLSPALSHESQSTQTLTSLSEPDITLPPGLDLSFVTEPSWNPPGPMVYSPASFRSAEPGLAHSQEHIGKPLPIAPCPQGMYPVAHPSMFFPSGGQVPYTPRTSYPALAPKRQLLPRTEGSSQSLQATHGSHRILRPYVQGQHVLHAPQTGVSSTAIQPHDGPKHPVAQAGAPLPSSTSGQTMPPGSQRMSHAPGFVQSAAVSRASAPAPYTVDPTAQDFSDFIHFDQEEQITSPAQLSYPQGFDLQPVPSALPVDSTASVHQPNQEANDVYPEASTMNSSLATESEEGRHRSHPLYAAEPQADGLFHCPYETTDPNCPHKPCKLKCAYDKYIDSHLKPFRCKIETCAKQEFSSTACLLRHEREAHGMHGHGDRPHLCYYTGCERGIPGNGFPRRYNLFDHMKRVHDHKEDPRAGTRSPSVSTSQDKKAAVSRKRKASDPVPLEPAVQRQRVTPAQHAQNVPAAQVYPVQPQEYLQQATYAVPAARRTQAHARVYSHWANQRELVERQMGAVQSPDDEAGLQRLTQNVEQLRRLSEAARRG